jgi:hypothetical protein
MIPEDPANAIAEYNRRGLQYKLAADGKDAHGRSVYTAFNRRAITARTKFDGEAKRDT